MPYFLFMCAFLLAYGAYTGAGYERVAKASSARPLAGFLLQQHDAAVRLVNADHSLVGVLTPALPAWRIASGDSRFTSCTAGGLTVTWTNPDAELPAAAIAVEMQTLNRGALGAGLVQGGELQQRAGSVPLPASCNIPNGAAAAVTRSF